ncbi:MAG TPA: ParB/RepB/Spo0J family partition protein [Burkholderiales bacterium]|nr:ParB/RepB/Spo0J family partition protein [Burkholderiales bacterium]
MKSETSSQLKDISPDLIRRNEDNPRLFFRPEEIDTLMASIKTYGIQVPITVYQEGGHYILIDGERRWRCALKLNLKSIPALIQRKPTPLDNLLLMFNIHALREQWDYFTIANRLPDVRERFKKERGWYPNEGELSAATGLTRGQIRRCLFLIDLPKKYKDELVRELSLPKKLQKLSEDFFIEMERSLKTIQNRVPSAVENTNKARDVLIAKFKTGVIGNITDFRMLSKIATAVDNLGITESRARTSIATIFNADNKIGIEEVYVGRFGLQYDERKIALSIDSVIDYLNTIGNDKSRLDKKLRASLKQLRQAIDKVLED